MKVKDRQGTVGKDVGVYNGKASRAWDDELLVGDKLSRHETSVELLLKDAVMRVSDDAEIIPEEDRVPPEAPQPRVSEADKKGDKTRLDRAMDRTLYLVVKRDGKDAKWEFPAAALSTEENLHEVGFSFFRHSLTAPWLREKRRDHCTDLDTIGFLARSRADRRRQHEHVDGRPGAGGAPRRQACG